ncbi:MAG TPA: hypothetical protein EYQ75_23920, partial [Planctomycetaceae bacterium]|nr:hypothetical protein [Planctomycetaceae bacterium]
RGGFSGGDRGRGGSSSGYSSRGGSSGGYSGFNPADMIARMDTNGNKMLDPSEMQGRSSFLIDRLSSVMRIDKSRPIPIDQIVRGFERLRNGGGGSGDSSRNRGSSSSSSSSQETESLVPGFGLDLGLDPVLGFGSLSEFFSVSVVDQDKKSAADRFTRYDRNKDGFLSQEELRSGRWSDDPMAYDRNKDGRISPSEMAVRYARRRVNESGGGGRESSSTSSVFFTGGLASSSSGGNSSSSKKVSKEEAERYGRFVSFMLTRYDRNKNGVLDKDEWGSLSGDASGSDKNRDGKLDKDEMIHYLANRSSSRSSGGDRGGDRGRSFGGGDRGRSSGGGDRGQYFTGRSEGSSGSSRQSKDDDRTSYRAMTPFDRLVKSGLEKELPDWFFEDDKNEDGQVKMHEYASRWDDATFDDFKQFDANRDGVITAAECIAALEDGARKGGGSSSRSSRSSGSSGSRSSGDSSGSDDKYLDYAKSQIAKYDTNKDRALTPEEWKSMSRSPEAADADKDGIVTAEELAESFKKK